MGSWFKNSSIFTSPLTIIIVTNLFKNNFFLLSIVSDEDEEDFDGEGNANCSLNWVEFLTKVFLEFLLLQMVTMQKNVKKRKKMTMKRNCQRTYVFTHIYIFFFKIKKKEQLLKVQRLNERKLYIDYNSRKSFEWSVLSILKSTFVH